MFETLRTWARRIKRELAVVYYAARDPRTPWHLKALGLAVAAYALSPIDLIPDFVPVLGYLDDLIIVPLGLWLVMKLLPQDVLQAARAEADKSGRLPVSKFAAATIVIAWTLALVLAAAWWWKR